MKSPKTDPNSSCGSQNLEDSKLAETLGQRE